MRIIKETPATPIEIYAELCKKDSGHWSDIKTLSGSYHWKFEVKALKTVFKLNKSFIRIDREKIAA